MIGKAGKMLTHLAQVFGEAFTRRWIEVDEDEAFPDIDRNRPEAQLLAIQPIEHLLVGYRRPDVRRLRIVEP